VKKFIINSKQVKRNCLDAVMNIRGDDQMEVVIQKHKQRKTDEQRSWFHVLCSMLGNETGYTLGEIKQMVKGVVLGSTTVSVGNQSFEVVESSEKQNRETYSQLIEGVYRLAAEAGIELPPARFIGDG
jgi:hypothetical protein